MFIQGYCEYLVSPCITHPCKTTTGHLCYEPVSKLEMTQTISIVNITQKEPQTKTDKFIEVDMRRRTEERESYLKRNADIPNAVHT